MTLIKFFECCECNEPTKFTIQRVYLSNYKLTFFSSGKFVLVEIPPLFLLLTFSVCQSHFVTMISDAHLTENEMTHFDRPALLD